MLCKLSAQSSDYREDPLFFSSPTILAHATLIAKGAHISLLCTSTDYNETDQVLFRKSLNTTIQKYLAALKNHYAQAKLPTEIEDIQIIFDELISNVFKAPLSTIMHAHPELIQKTKITDGPTKRIELIKTHIPQANLGTKLFIEAEIFHPPYAKDQPLLRIEISNRGILQENIIESINWKLSPEIGITEFLLQVTGNQTTGTESIGLIMARDKIHEYNGHIRFDYIRAQQADTGRIVFLLEFPLIP